MLPNNIKKKIISKMDFINKNIYNSFSSTKRPIFFDTTLRDGIQTANPNDYSTQHKMDIFKNIITNYRPASIEIGSLVSPKVLPIMKDTCELFLLTKEYLENSISIEKNAKGVNKYNPDIFVLVPSFQKLQEAIQIGFTNFSFISSVSEEFQRKNTKKSIIQTKDDLQDCMMYLRCEFNGKYKTKLYISCINNCPIIGPMNNDLIVYEILNYYNRFLFNELCLSDTCGNLQFEDFVYIIEQLKNRQMDISKISLHLHTSESNMQNIEKIIIYCLDNGIHKFDFSLLETGGCSVTMRSDKLKPNLSYKLFYEIYDKYLFMRDYNTFTY
jgi:isopropylmalate/homocitrate/citramalate synthase